MKIRLLGILLLGISLTAFWWLTHLVALPAAERSTALQLAVAFVAVPAWLLGLPMLALGDGLIEPTEVPIRSWYAIRHRSPRP